MLNIWGTGVQLRKNKAMRRSREDVPFLPRTPLSACLSSLVSCSRTHHQSPILWHSGLLVQINWIRRHVEASAIDPIPWEVEGEKEAELRGDF